MCVPRYVISDHLLKFVFLLFRRLLAGLVIITSPNHNNISNLSIELPRETNYSYDHDHEHGFDALKHSFCGSASDQSLSIISKKSDDAITVSVFKMNKTKNVCGSTGFRSPDTSIILGPATTVEFADLNEPQPYNRRSIQNHNNSSCNSDTNGNGSINDNSNDNITNHI